MSRIAEGKYEVLRAIGRGASGTVYEAREVASGARVAIKWLNVRALRDEDPEVQRFMQEARIAGALASNHVPRLLDLGRDAATSVPYLVMELFAGEDVRALVARAGALQTKVAATIARQAAQGLAAAHAAGVVHRDVKPANLFLARGEGHNAVARVLVLDFGLAKIRRSTEDARADAGPTAPARSLTESGQVLGTPLFTAPEQIEGDRHVDARTDVFALGVTLFAMLAGAPPHAEVRSLVELLYKRINEPPPPLRNKAPWVPEGMVAVVERAMATDKQGRFPSALAFAEALDPWADDAALNEGGLRAPGMRPDDVRSSG